MTVDGEVKVTLYTSETFKAFEGFFLLLFFFFLPYELLIKARCGNIEQLKNIWFILEKKAAILQLLTKNPFYTTFIILFKIMFCLIL